MIVIFGGNKCAGKSTALSNCAVNFSKYQSLSILDADKQASIAKWHKRRKENKLEVKYDLYQDYGNISKRLLELNNIYSLVLVDVAGINSEEFISALGVADLAIITLEPTIKVLETLDELIIQYKQIFKVNPDLKYAFAQVRTKIGFGEPRRRNYFLQNCEKLGFGKILKTVVHDRDSFFNSDEFGGTVFETKDEKAQNEIIELSKEIVQYINN